MDLDRVVIYGPFEVAPEWQEHIPDQFGVSLFDKWRWHIQDALVAAIPAQAANRHLIRPGYVLMADPYRLEFHENTFSIYWGHFLLARVECHYDDDKPSPPKPFSPQRTRGAVP